MAARTARPARLQCMAVARPTPRHQKAQEASPISPTMALAGMAFFAPYLADIDSALAAGGEYGILEGRTIALIHPAVMGSLFAGSVYAGYLGLQWRRTRTIGDDIKALKAQAPKVPVAAGDAPAAPAPPSALDQQIAGLEKVRGAMKATVVVAF